MKMLPWENAFVLATGKLDSEHKAGRHTDVGHKVLRAMTCAIEGTQTKMYKEENVSKSTRLDK